MKKKKEPPFGLFEILQEMIDFQADSVLIKEGLLYSYSPSFIFSHLIHSLGFEQRQIKLKIKAGNTKIFEIQIEKKDFTNINKLMPFMNNVCGWFSSSILAGHKNGKFNKKSFDEAKINLSNNIIDFFVISFEAKFDIVIDQKLIYHVTDEEKAEKIHKIGLKPSSNSKIVSHPDRVYFTLTLDAAKKLLEQFKYLPVERPKNYCILEIDVFQLPEGVAFFQDPHFMNADSIGIFTLSNIPSGCIFNVRNEIS